MQSPTSIRINGALLWKAVVFGMTIYTRAIRRFQIVTPLFLLLVYVSSVHGEEATIRTTPIRVACVGDSITAGSGIENPEVNSYPAQLQQLLGDRYEVRNFGVGGTGICRSAVRKATGWHRDYRQQPAFESSLEFAPDFVVINLGVNDVVEWSTLRDEFIPCYLELIQRYQRLATQPQIVIWQPLAPAFPGQKFAGHPHLDEINESLVVVAQKSKVRTVDLRTPLLDHADLFPDHLHPNAAAAKMISETVGKAIQQISMPQLTSESHLRDR